MGGLQVAFFIHAHRNILFCLWRLPLTLLLTRIYNKFLFKCALSVLKQFLETKNPLKMIANAFYLFHP